MSHSPTEDDGQAAARDYEAAWRALFRLLREGRSFSGRERNVCFLNTGGPRFGRISATSGLDYIDDGRALATTDWDHDGDLDMWLMSRTSPRIRFSRNNQRTGNHFLVVGLEGRDCNRDAIGARLELHFEEDEDGRKLIRTIRAGEGFLAQSSKWVHFGLGDATAIGKLVVRWPGGEPEEFTGLRADRRYRIVQGSGEARAQESRRRKPELAAAMPDIPAVTDRAGIFLLAPVPAPTLRFKDFDGRAAALPETSGPVLLNLWASWCRPCVAELEELTRRRAELQDKGVEVVALSVDGLGDDPATGPEDARAMLERLGFPFTGGWIEPATLDQLQLLYNVLLPNRRSLPVPTSFLINPGGEIAAIYKGPVAVERVLEDAGRLRATFEERLALAVPFAGRWNVAPAPPFFEYLDPIGAAFQESGYTGEAVAYYRHMLRYKPDHPIVNRRLGDLLAQLGESQQAVEHYRRSLAADPGSAEAHYGLGVVLDGAGQEREAVEHYRAALDLDPQHGPARNNLAVALARQGDHEEALANYRRVVSLEPENMLARLNLGLGLLKKGEIEEAVLQLGEAVRLDPAHADARYHLGRVLAQQGSITEAMTHLKEATRLKPDFTQAHVQIGRLHAQQGNGREAAREFGLALERQPGNLGAAQSLAWILATDPDPAVRDGAEAVRLARSVCEETRYEHPAALDTLAAAYAGTSRFGEAVETARKALELAQASGDQGFAEQIQRRLRLYEAGLPLHEAPGPSD